MKRRVAAKGKSMYVIFGLLAILLGSLAYLALQKGSREGLDNRTNLPTYKKPLPTLNLTPNPPNTKNAPSPPRMELPPTRMSSPPPPNNMTNLPRYEPPLSPFILKPNPPNIKKALTPPGTELPPPE